MRMPISSETRAALMLLKEIQANTENNDDINTLISVLESPVLQSILNIQDSLRELKRQVHLHPSILPADFDITPSGELVLNLPQTTDENDENSGFQNGYDSSTKNDESVSSELKEQRENTNFASIHPEKFKSIIEESSQGRDVKYIKLYKPEGCSLGFSVVGLRSEFKGELGIYIQEIQKEGLAGKDGRLVEGDQILAIDGQPLDANISHQQAINILQRAEGHVDLVVARNSTDDEQPQSSSMTNATNSDWCQVEIVELVNNGSGLGFGIIGGQKKGVVVKTILPDGVADRDGRLRAGDFILQINEHWLQGVGSEQVAAVLRGTGNRVKLIVARPVESGSATNDGITILPTSMLENRSHFEKQLEILTSATSLGPSSDLPADMVLPPTEEAAEVIAISPSQPQATSPVATTMFQQQQPTTPSAVEMMPEMETLEVELVKDLQGLGITIAGYTCEREELSGIFVKSVTEGSAASRSGKVSVNDQIVEVDGKSIQGYTNQQAVEMLRSTGKTVKLKLIRYVHGLKFEQLQQAIANSQSATPTTSTSSSSPSSSSSTTDSPIKRPATPEPPPTSDFEGEIDPEIERELITKWSELMGPDFEIVVAQLQKFKLSGGLGISLEGTVEKVDGEEQNPHHYIRSVLPNGPVGQNGSLRSGDELLEVNGRTLLGLYHTDVVSILKDLPMWVRIVCARAVSTDLPRSKLLSSDRMVKAKSLDDSVNNENCMSSSSSMSLKSRSLEPLTSLAMWSDEVLDIELVKSDKGLGFSILDYQDPMNKDEIVIVIRSLVPGGVAQQDGRLIPGDRLMRVNEIDLSHANLDEAVQALKGASTGIVNIGVSKPIQDQQQQTFQNSSDSTTGVNTEDTMDSEPPPLPTSPLPVEEEEEEEEKEKQQQQQQQPAQSQQQNEQQKQQQPEIAFPSTERLIGKRQDNIPPLPETLEHNIKVVKIDDTLGIQVEPIDEGINGVLVRSLEPRGTLDRDGRIKPGDYLVKVQNESLRNLHHSEAIDILQRTSNIPLHKEIQISYIPADDALVCKTSSITRMACERPIPAARGKTIISITNQNEKVTETSELTAPLVSPEQSEIVAKPNTEQSAPTPPPPLEEIEAEETEEEEEEEFLPPPPLPTTPPPSVSTPMVPPRPSKSLSSSESLSIKGVDNDEDNVTSTDFSEEEKDSALLKASSTLSAKHWGPVRTVTLSRNHKGWGISIVGGKAETSASNEDSEDVSDPQSPTMSGIFIKNVLEESPAGLSGQLSTGDRILEVQGHDLRTASHDFAAKVIRQSGKTAVFVVQSLLPLSGDQDDTEEEGSQDDEDDDEYDDDDNEEDEKETEQEEETVANFEVPAEFANPSANDEEEENLDDEDSDSYISGEENLASGYIIDRASAGYLTKQNSDPDEEDDYGYTMDKIKRKYSKLKGELKCICLNKGTHGLGISLGGHKDRSQLSVFVCGLIPQGNAARDGRIKSGDCVLEVNGKVLYKRCHLNASTLIKNLPDSAVTFVVLTPEDQSQCAVKPLTTNQFPKNLLNKDNPIELYQKYPDLRQIQIKKGNQGLGIMIMEGKHVEGGTGVFISDLQHNSPAYKAGLMVGDIILCVNGEDLVGASYETAARILKSLEGIINIVVANPNSKKREAEKAEEEMDEERDSKDKPKLPPKPPIAPKPAGLSPTHKPLSPTMSTSIATVSATTTTTSSGAVMSIPVVTTIASTSSSSTTISTTIKKPVASPRRDKPISPATCEIIPGADTTIEITKDKDEDGKPMGLGLSIVGGSDTLLKAIFIHEVYEKGAAHKDGRLRPGDQILEVMNEDLRNVTHSNALHALRQTPNRVRLVIHREDEEIYETIEVELLKRKDRGLGLSIVGKKSGPGVYISEVVKGGAADSDGRLVQGDQIISVNGNDLTNSSQEEAAPILKMAYGKIFMKVRRLRVGNRQQQQPQRLLPQHHQQHSNDSNSIMAPVINGIPKTIRLERGNMGLGFSIVGGFGSPHGDMPIYVKNVFETGAAAEHGGLKRGDQIVSVNNISLEGLTHQDAVNILKNCEGTVTIQLLT